MTITRTIAGRPLTLTADLRYRASRPFATRGRRIFPVTIECLEPAFTPDEPRIVINGLNYDEANAFLADFNNGPTSFDGRLW